MQHQRMQKNKQPVRQKAEECQPEQRMSQETVATAQIVKQFAQIFADRQIAPQRRCWLINVRRNPTNKIGKDRNNSRRQRYAAQRLSKHYDAQGRNCRQIMSARSEEHTSE